MDSAVSHGRLVNHALYDICAQTKTNLLRAIELLNLVQGVRLKDSDVVWLQSARAKLLIACRLLEEANAPVTLVSVSELVLKAELCLATIDVQVNALSMRVAEAVLVE